MIIIPLYVFFFIYLGILLCLLFFALINVKHLVLTGTFTLASFVATFLFFAFSVLVLWVTWSLLQDVNWQGPVVIWNNDWFSNALNSGTSNPAFNL